jgi:hypothetical protein
LHHSSLILISERSYTANSDQTVCCLLVLQRSRRRIQENPNDPTDWRRKRRCSSWQRREQRRPLDARQRFPVRTSRRAIWNRESAIERYQSEPLLIFCFSFRNCWASPFILGDVSFLFHASKSRPRPTARQRVRYFP